MPEEQKSWLSNMYESAGRILNGGRTANFRFFNLRTAAITALSTYFYEDMSNPRYVSAKSASDADAPILSGKDAALRDIPLYEAISPLKLLNPFKLISAASVFIRISLSALIDQNLENYPRVSKYLKNALTLFGVIQVMALPLATFEKIPFIQKTASFLGIQSPLEKMENTANERPSFLQRVADLFGFKSTEKSESRSVELTKVSSYGNMMAKELQPKNDGVSAKSTFVAKNENPKVQETSSSKEDLSLDAPEHSEVESDEMSFRR